MNPNRLTRRAFLTAIAASTITLRAALIAPQPIELPGELSVLLLGRDGDEVTYRGYQRAAVPRNAASWHVFGRQATNKIAVTFPECTGRSQETTGFGICIDGEPVALGELTSPLFVTAGVTPEFLPGSLPMMI